MSGDFVTGAEVRRAAKISSPPPVLRASQVPDVSISQFVDSASSSPPLALIAALNVHEVILLRPTNREDRGSMIDLFERCSEGTRRLRFLSTRKTFPEPYLTQALERAPGRLDVVAVKGESVVALASSVPVNVDTNEIGILVQDSMQRRGVGGLLLEVLVDHARRSAVATLLASASYGQSWIITQLSRHGKVTSTTSYGVMELTVTHLMDSQKYRIGFL